MNNRGSSLVELILYTGLITTILVVLYQLFALSAFQKIGEIVEDELYSNAHRVISDLERTIKSSTTITTPVAGTPSNSLSLNNGAIIYQLDGNNRLIKTEGGVPAFLTNEEVTLSTLTFNRYGPSTESPTVAVAFTILGNHLVEGREKSEDFEVSFAVR